MRSSLTTTLTVTAALFMGAVQTTAAAADAPKAEAVIATYADIAHATYEDSLITAKMLRDSVAALAEAPSAETLANARAAWKIARAPYQQTEGYRFGNPIVDAWEGRVNAWPLDEGLIDYVDPGYGESSDTNLYYAANIIANPKLTLSGKEIDATEITPELISGTLHEIDAVESNVASGYHAIEFLLWGQDLNGTDAGAGNRPYTDFDTANCTNGNCDRRVAYLVAASDLLITDLQEITAAWADDGAARAEVMADSTHGIAAILNGLGSLSYGELAGERIKLGLMLHDPEEEHDCFSDNTHNSHYYDQVGMMSIYVGHYTRFDGSVVSGPSVNDLIVANAPEVATSIKTAMATTLTKMQVMKDTADNNVMAYDQMIGEGNETGNQIIQDVVDGLVVQAKAIEQAMGPLGLSGLEFEGSDSLDNPTAVFQ